MRVRVLMGQTLFDIALQVYGSIEGIVPLALENGLSVTDSLYPGQILNYSLDNIIDSKIVKYYATYNIHPATAFAEDLDNRIFDETYNLTFN